MKDWGIEGCRVEGQRGLRDCGKRAPLNHLPPRGLVELMQPVGSMTLRRVEGMKAHHLAAVVWSCATLQHMGASLLLSAPAIGLLFKPDNNRGRKADP